MVSDEPRELLLYCLTRDHGLATAVDESLSGALAFFYNNAARLHQALVLRSPDIVLLDTGAIRQEYGDAGLGPVVGFVRERAPAARIAVRPTPGTEWLIRAEAGEHVELLPADREACVGAVAILCAPA